MAILDTAACADAVIPLCKASYTAESGAPLIFTADGILSWLENQLYNGFGTKNIERVVYEAMLIIVGYQKYI